ncbi:glycosyltransferase family 1 protein [Rhodococcus sp. ACPA4]|uniref:Glycosyltransferase involved in cell wall biosynthesis n=1 Tax=Nocardia globerula TaxID=1818 RepID=A0A652YL76_NOCGL|nr:MULTISPECIES: glycosyltransferase family 4 protein [Rhodococcus]NMD60165.1 glycosyltransferase family 4 protein [Nocardia globerula]PBC42656.1 glycosyltransferase family 1 protein [Rhodococcus sp. ACPA4]PVX63721.1 glycosyltransferase involved in cell wall biosynthesis [Rhodococcus globerulus]RZL26184.1 MAG: glycosyltransferase family 1 protein [Rhodococcus sp. (in: high G+C Gram-positive bacteria)]
MHEVLLLCWRDTGHPQGGGSERYLEQVGTQLAARGIKVTLRTASYPGAPAAEYRDGITISRSGGRFSVYPRALAAIAAGRLGFGSLKGLHPDAVVDTQNGIPFFSKMVAGAPVTLLVHHCHREQWPVAGTLVGRIGWWVESRLSPKRHSDNQYLTVSLPSAEELVDLGVDRDRIAVVRNGADRLPMGVDAGGSITRAIRPTMSVLSRLVPHKQIEDALEAVATLRPTQPELHLDVIGGGWWEQNLRDRAAELGIGDAVTFHGHVDESRKHELLAQSWIHLMPSRKEGWGLAVIEAAQHGVPTVGYRSSKGLTDSIVDGVTGLLVGGESVGDGDVAELTQAAGTLLQDHELRTVLGEKARVWSSEFSWEQTGTGVFEVLSATTVGQRVSGLVTSRESNPVLVQSEHE